MTHPTVRRRQRRYQTIPTSHSTTPVHPRAPLHSTTPAHPRAPLHSTTPLHPRALESAACCCTPLKSTGAWVSLLCALRWCVACGFVAGFFPGTRLHVWRRRRCVRQRLLLQPHRWPLVAIPCYSSKPLSYSSIKNSYSCLYDS